MKYAEHCNVLPIWAFLITEFPFSSFRALKYDIEIMFMIIFLWFVVDISRINLYMFAVDTITVLTDVFVLWSVIGALSVNVQNWKMHLYISEYFISPPDCCKQAYVLPLFLIYFFIFKRFLPDQLSQNLPDQFSPSCKVGIMVTVDDQFKISLSVPQGTLPWQPNFIGSIQIIELSHTIEVQWHSPDGSGIREK